MTHIPLLDSHVRFVAVLPALQDLILRSTGLSNIEYASPSSHCRTEIDQGFPTRGPSPSCEGYKSRVDNDSATVSVASAKIRYLGSVGTRIDTAGARRLTAGSL